MPCDTLVTAAEPVLMRYHQPKSSLHQASLAVLHPSVDFEKRLMLCIYHYRTVQKDFTSPPNVLCSF